MINRKELRAQINAAIKTKTKQQKLDESKLLLNQLAMDKNFQRAQMVLLYWSLPNEVDTHEFVRQWSASKHIILPVVVGDDLELRYYEGDAKMQTGAYGILEPNGKILPRKDYDLIDVCLVPGVAFDKMGNRMGHGKGYYDRLLPKIERPKIGICFPEQLVEDLEPQPWDVPMDKVIGSL